jgi:hypothetical protein
MRRIYGILGFFLGIMTGVFLAVCVWFGAFFLFLSDTPNPSSSIIQEYATNIVAIIAFVIPVLLMPVYMTRYHDRLVAAGKDIVYLQKKVITTVLPVFIIFLIFLWVWSPILLSR